MVSSAECNQVWTVFILSVGCAPSSSFASSRSPASSSKLCVHRRTAARIPGSLAHQIQAEFHCNFAGIDRTLPGPRLMEPVSLIGYHADADGNYIVESRHL